MAEASSHSKRYCIILKCNPETDITDEKQRADKPFKSLRRNAVTGAIWIIDDTRQRANDDGTVILTSVVSRSFCIETPRSNIKEITEQEYAFLEAVPHERRIGVLENELLPELLRIKIYDKITVALNVGSDQEIHRDCIVHYIGPLEHGKATYFGVVFENDIGDTDGSVGDKIYFVARSNHGKFITIDSIMSISRGKFQRMSNLFSSASLEDLTGKHPLRKRTKSQTQLLSLAGTGSSAESTENSPVVSKKDPVVDLIKVKSSPLLSKVAFSSLTETRMKPDTVKMRLNYESATKTPKNRNSDSGSGGLRRMNLKHLETHVVESNSNRTETNPGGLNNFDPDSSNMFRNTKRNNGVKSKIEAKVELLDNSTKLDARSFITESDRHSASAASNSGNSAPYPEGNAEDDVEPLSSDLQVNSRVVFFDDSGIPLHGTIKYIGTLDDSIQVGVELDARITEIDGNFKDGKKVFDCPTNKGLLCRPEELIKENLMEMQLSNVVGKIIVDKPCSEPPLSKKARYCDIFVLVYSAPETDQNNNLVALDSSDENFTSTRRKKERSKSTVGEEHFSCPICLDTVEEAIETTCCHQIFCEKCIRKHRELTCPKCRKKPFTIIVSHFVRKLVGNFNMECTNEGCYQILTRSDMKYHKVKCAFEKIRCPNDGCKTKFVRSSLEEHLKMCRHALVKCQNKGCLLRIARQDLTEHDQCCDYSEITCTNDGCHVTMIRLKLSRHLRESCRFIIACCPVPGCRYKSTGGTLGEHLSTDHYEMFMRHLDELKGLYAKDQDAGIFTVQWSSKLRD